MARGLVVVLVLAVACGCNTTLNDVGRSIILPEQRSISYRSVAQLPPAPIPPSQPPRTVSNPQPETEPWQLSLDDAIRIALQNARVIRVLAGTTAVSTGQTIYDTAITNTTIDQKQARFDPVLSQGNLWNHADSPQALFHPLDARRSFLTGTQRFDYRSDFGLSQATLIGGLSALRWITNPTRFDAAGLPLNPQTPSSVELSYSQPLLKGAGFRVNAAPIVIARLNTEQSFFQYKDMVQELVRGVAEGYWNLVQARVNVWARGIQVQQSKEAFDREEARSKTGPRRADHLPQRTPGAQRLGERALVGSTIPTDLQRRAASLERRTGTILETHGLVFYEERFRAPGPLLVHERSYPSALPPVGSPHQYPGSDAPAENSFDLRNPTQRDRIPPQAEELPRPRPVNPMP